MSAPDDVCPLCEGELLWADEISTACPSGTGYEILICNECDYIARRRWVGH